MVRFPLRAKLALVALVLLVLPWAGWLYVREMERFLLAAQEEALAATARAVATALHERPKLLAYRARGESELPNYISVYGSTGTLHVGWKESKFRRASDAEWTVFGTGYDKVQAFRSQIDNFVRSIQGLEAPLITLADALASVEVIDAAYDAMWRAAWVAVDSELSKSLVAA